MLPQAGDPEPSHTPPWKLSQQPLPSLVSLLVSLSFFAKPFTSVSLSDVAKDETGHYVRVNTPILEAFKQPVAWISPIRMLQTSNTVQQKQNASHI